MTNGERIGLVAVLLASAGASISLIVIVYGTVQVWLS